MALQVHDRVLVGTNYKDGMRDSRSTTISKAYSALKTLLHSILALKEGRTDREQNPSLYDTFYHFYV